ncbi:2OG-Fe(II) oxygenase [Membranicola marinus]|uniref:2OG-Fe(II) oxygenase n=1 Tax=Membranihabitans marinus TaxID=1227546 RepID=A0A953HNN4_9BACT|nr:2OG-Fe(II) oxygenase [Membranihabitans marinus]MBY5958942.1 2OG-Fe(II) oxygenase [Membranihabitans marinus]
MAQFISPKYANLRELAQECKAEYQSARPFPYIYFDNFFDPEFLSSVLDEFPDLEKKKEIHYSNPNEEKLATRGEYSFQENTRKLVHYLNSQPFLEFLNEMTGIKETLVPDPYFEGGGFHQIKPGGFLKVHVDFHKHRKMNLDRRLNLLIYLNKDWKEEYGGHFELWKTDMSECGARIAPLFNRVALFSTTDLSYHGHPDKLTCPPDRSRKSLALYYYSNGRSDSVDTVTGKRITTTFASRKGQDSPRMKVYNNAVNLANDLLPPIVVRTIKKFRNT